MPSKVNADVEMHLHQRSAIAAMAAFENRFKSMMQSMEGDIKSQGKHTKDVADGFDKWVQNLKKSVIQAGSLLVTFGTVRKVVDLIRMDIDAAVQSAEKAKDKQLTFAEAMADIHFTLPATSTMTADDIQKRIMSSTSPYKEAMANAVRGAISAGLTEDVEDRAETALRISELRPDLARSKPEQLQALVEAVMIGRRAYGGTVEEQLGSMLTAASAARTTDIGAFSENIGGIMPILKQFGFNQRDALAFGASLSQAMNDPSGETTRTNAYTFVAQLREELSARGRQDIVGGDMFRFISDPNNEMGREIRNKLAGFLQAGLSQQETEELAAIQADPKIEGRARGKVALIQMLDAAGEKGPEHLQSMYATAQQEVLTGDAAGRFVEKRVQDLKSQSWYQTFLAQMAADAFLNQAALIPEKGLRGVATSTMKDVDPAMDNSWVANMPRRWLFEGNMASPQNSEEVLNLFMDQLYGRQAGLFDDGNRVTWRQLKDLFEGNTEGIRNSVGEIPLQQVLDTLSERDLKMFEALSTMIKSLMEIRDAIKDSNKDKPVQQPKKPASRAPVPFLWGP